MMKNVLIVTSHPCVDSFNFALTAQAIKTFEHVKCSVHTTNLYQEGFSPLLNEDDLPSRKGAAKKLRRDIITEQKKILDADLIIVQFPIWWGSFPAILKGWIERVFTDGFAYGSSFRLADKPILLSATTGGACNESENVLYINKLKMISEEVFGYMNMNILSPFICHGPANICAEQRLEQLHFFSQHLIEQYNAYFMN